MLDRSFIKAPNGLILPRTVAAKIVRKGRRPKAMDFFAGAGGMSCGLIQAGYEVVAAAEYEPYAALTYATNLCRYGALTMHFVTPEDEKRTSAYIEKSYRRAGLTVKDGHVVADGKLAQAPVWVAGSGWIRGQDPSVKGVSHLFIGDVRKLTSERVLKAIGMQPGELDLIAGGPPCQGFSKAGKQNICDPRNSLIYEFARFIQEMQPRSFVMEEVPEVGTMMDPDGVPVLEKFLRLVEPAGFEGYDAFKRIAHGSPTRGAALRSNTPRGLNGKAKRDRKKDAPTARAPRAPAVAQTDLFA